MSGNEEGILKIIIDGGGRKIVLHQIDGRLQPEEPGQSLLSEDLSALNCSRFE